MRLPERTQKALLARVSPKIDPEDTALGDLGTWPFLAYPQVLPHLWEKSGGANTPRALVVQLGAGVCWRYPVGGCGNRWSGVAVCGKCDRNRGANARMRSGRITGIGRCILVGDERRICGAERHISRS